MQVNQETFMNSRGNQYTVNVTERSIEQETAFQKIIAEKENMLRKAAERSTSDGEAAAQDIYSKALARTYRKFPAEIVDFDPERKEYLVRFCLLEIRRAAIDHARSQSRIERAKAAFTRSMTPGFTCIDCNGQAQLASDLTGLHFDLFDPNRESLTEKIEGTDTVRLIYSLLFSLPSKQREAFSLKVFGDMTFKKIAEKTKKPLHTIAGRYRRACDSLIGLLSQELGPLELRELQDRIRTNRSAEEDSMEE